MTKPSRSPSGPPSSTEPAKPPLRPLGPGTMSRTFVLRITLLVAITAVLLDSAALAMARAVWMASLDAELYTAQNSPIAAMPPSGGARGPWASELDMQVIDGQVHVALAFDRNGATALTQEQIDALMDVRLDGRARTLNLPGLGPFRVAAQVTPAGTRVVGVSMMGVSAAFAHLMMTEILFTMAAVIAAAVVAAAVVRVTLRPLTTMAAIATRVGGMRLDQGEVRLGRLGGAAVNPASEVGQVGLAFNHMLGNVEDALVARHRSEEKVRAFVADASHELRNPLAAIRGYAELMGRDKALSGQALIAVERINSESRRMSNLVDEMLLLARLDAGRNIAMQRVDLARLVIDSVADATVAGPDHHWKMDVTDLPVEVTGDENQLREVVSNLLGNARKHTPSGTHVLVTLRTETGTPDATSTRSGGVGPFRRGHGDQTTYSVHTSDTSVYSVPDTSSLPGIGVGTARAVLTVADDGPGIPADLQNRVFERFVRADQARTHDDEGSTGLGLAIVAGVVEAHGGQVDLESAPGATRFTVILPIAAPELAAS